MNFTPKSEQQIIEESLLKPGTYDFEVVTAAEKTSKAGNDMIELNLRVFDDNGGSQLVRDYIMESMPMKLRRAAYACGLGDLYESGTLHDYDFEDKSGRAKIVVKQDKSGQFPDQNSVRDYLIAAATPSASPTAQVADLQDDSIPF